jgi:hypothetical protein
MVGMLVRDENSVEALRARPAEGFKPPENFPASYSRVDEEGSAFGFEQRGVARAAGGQN